MNMAELCMNPDSIEASSPLFKHSLLGTQISKRVLLNASNYFTSFILVSFFSYLTQTPVTRVRWGVNGRHTQTNTLEERQDMTVWPLCEPQIPRLTDKEKWSWQAGWHSQVGLDQIFFWHLLQSSKRYFKIFFFFFTPSLKTILLSFCLLFFNLSKHL